MKANEAPEKIYLQENTTTDCYGEWWPEWFEARAKDTDIKYTRTDVFIEKACEWITENVEKHISADGEYTVYYEEMFKDFKSYIKGE